MKVKELIDELSKLDPEDVAYVSEVMQNRYEVTALLVGTEERTRGVIIVGQIANVGPVN